MKERYNYCKETIGKYLQENPNARPKDIENATGINTKTVYKWWHYFTDKQ